MLNECHEIEKISEVYSQIKYLHQIPYGNKIAIYGKNVVGISLLKLIKKVRSDLEVLCFIDSFESGNFYGLKTYSLKEFISFKNDVDAILLTHLDKISQIKGNLLQLDKNKLKICYCSSLQYFNDFEATKIDRFDEKVAFISSNLDEMGTLAWNSLVSGMQLKSLFPIYEYTCKHGTHLDYLKNCNDMEGFTVIDAGSYDGENSLIFLNKIGPAGKVYAFEPLGSQVFSAAFKDRLMNDQRLVFEEAGLWSKNAELSFHVNSQASSFMDSHNPLNTSNVSCTVKSLDSYASKNKINKINFIKMDIEGAEIDALKGASKIIKRDRPMLAITIYHGYDQYVEVPYFIMNEFPEYEFTIDVHSVIGMDAVIYCTPSA